MKTLRTVSLACAVFVSGGGSQQFPVPLKADMNYCLPGAWALLLTERANRFVQWFRGTANRGFRGPNRSKWRPRRPWNWPNTAEFLREFDEYERNFDSSGPAKRCRTSWWWACPRTASTRLLSHH